MPTFKSQAGFAVDVILAGVDLGRFKTMTAPKLTADAFKVRPPGGPERAVPNPVRSREDATVTRKVTLEDDMARQAWVDTLVGVGDANLVYRALDNAQNAWGVPMTYHGILIDAEFPETDSDEGAADALVSLTFALDELAG